MLRSAAQLLVCDIMRSVDEAKLLVIQRHAFNGAVRLASAVHCIHGGSQLQEGSCVTDVMLLQE
jgi:hypothetical protein